MEDSRPIILEARKLVKKFGQVVALDHTDFELRMGEILAVIGDNGAGKSTLIKMFSGAMRPDQGQILIHGKRVTFGGPIDARSYGIETVYQDLAVAPSLSIVDNLFLGREYLCSGWMGRLLRVRDKKRMTLEARRHMEILKMKIGSMSQSVDTLSGGQRQGVSVVRGAAFAQHVVIMDEPTAALGVKESGMVEALIRKVRERGLAIILISHNMPQVFSLADRIHVQRLGKRVALINPKEVRMEDAVAIMTGAK